MDNNPYAAPTAENYREVVAPAGPGSCPLCGEIKLMKRPKRLYGREVCARCAHGFANRRQFAYVIDTLVLVAISLVVYFSLAMVAVRLNWTEEQFGLVESAVNLAFIAVFVAKDAFRGYSPGKYLMDVRVIDARSGIPTGLKGSVLRNLPLIIPVVPLIVAVTMMKGKRLGDGWARTKVIWNRFADRELFQPEAAATAVMAR